MLHSSQVLIWICQVPSLSFAARTLFCVMGLQAQDGAPYGHGKHQAPQASNLTKQAVLLLSCC